MLSMKADFEVLTAVTTKITVLWGWNSLVVLSTDVSEEEAASIFRADGKNRFL